MTKSPQELVYGTKAYLQNELKDIKIIYAACLNGKSQSEFALYFIQTDCKYQPHPTLEKIWISPETDKNGKKVFKDKPGTWGKSRNQSGPLYCFKDNGYYLLVDDLWTWLGFSAETTPKIEGLH